MENKIYTVSVEKKDDNSVFKIIDTVGNCVGKMMFREEKGKMGNMYKISLLGTSNGGDQLDEIGIDGVVKLPEKIPGLLYIMFKQFIDYILSIDKDAFTININKPLLTLKPVYSKLYLRLLKEGNIDSGVVKDDIVVLRCD
ncbi:hypothetical protein H7170_04180 [Candidatus Gracilibacteria bacterium]|nr:hypothetical protein [Candidatus Gracilibacteria bacterium]